MMAKTVHLIVEQGNDRGLQITVPPEGGRLGRSSKNDIVVVDPLLSRHHCRLFFKTGDGLWISDLGSSNETLVNGKPIQESPLRAGDRLTLGDTVMKIVNDGIGAAVPGPVVDLGLETADRRPSRPGLARGPLIIIACLMLALAAAVWVPKLVSRRPASPKPTLDVAAPPSDWPIEILYEKVEARADNIFRYELRLDDKSVLSVKIDDVQSDRHVRKEKALAEDYIHYLAKLIEDAGFFALSPAYEGLQPDIVESRDMSITVGTRTHRSRVLNRLEPDAFRDVRELIEECGKRELGLWAIQYSPEKLQEMAREAYWLGKKLFDDREVKYGNLFDAITSFEEAEWHLETVEPKPDFYNDAMAAKSQCREILDRMYTDQNYTAQRAIRMRQWDKAISELRVIIEMVPDRSDPRNRAAYKELIEMENRLRLQK